MEDTEKELERLQKALLEDELLSEEDLTEDLPEDLTQGMEDILSDALLEELTAEPELPEETEAQLPEEEAPLVVDDATLDALLAELSGPALETDEDMSVSDDTMVFHNYSNDYGKELAEYGEADTENAAAARQKKRDDKVIIGLMITASVLCLGIIGMLAYWLVAFLK